MLHDATREHILKYINNIHEERLRRHLDSANKCFDWLSEHPIEVRNGMDIVSTEGIDAAIIMHDFRFGANLKLQPMRSDQDCGGGAGMIVSKDF